MKPRIARKFEKDVRTTALPDWFPVLQIVVAIAVGLLLFVAIFRSPDPVQTTPAPVPPPAPTNPVNPSPTTSGATPAPSTPVASPTPSTPSPTGSTTAGQSEIIPTASGLQLTVPSQAAATGRAAAVALVTGDFGEVPVNGTTPKVTTATPGATASAMTVMYASTTSYTFDVKVSAGGTTTSKTVVVDLVDGQWMFTPGGDAND